ncbi:conserved exported hypothetical protein [Candidatus Desulfosporosinus infrequens]|uniref:Uncharacterized protein n=1 Tax=Candidatus Desulfosporosinus infrequens TaxID=2043169 RepID=A0A2U3LM00_9FIRM|nr:conserved exported hypothetical protein [Candidatus Desulfosporosinus infrequens]
MIKKNLKGAVIAFIVGILFATSTVVALGAEASSNWFNFGPYSGYSYQNQATVYSDTTDVFAYTEVANQNWTDVPVGYMGAEARLFNSSGYLVNYSNMSYNGTETGALSVLTDSSTHDTYYSLGITAVYNNSDGYYYNEDTYMSPRINF